MKRYFWGLVVMADQGINTVLWPLLNFVFKSNRFGYPDETLSSVFGKEVRSGNCKSCYYICLALHFLDKNHCSKSIEDDEGRY